MREQGRELKLQIRNLTDMIENMRGGTLFPKFAPIAVPDVVQAFKNAPDEGTFQVQHGGQSYIATARRGSSLETLKPVGMRVPSVTSPGATEPWYVTKITDEILTDLEQQSGNRQQQRNQ